VVKAFYEAHIQPALETEVQKLSYQPGTLFRLDKTDDFREYINALQLQIGLHVPVKASSDDAEDMAEGSEISWSIDRKIAFGSLTADASLTVDHKEFEEIYQHLRFSFANWFSLAPATFKTEINKIIFKDGGPNIDLPLYEKRQRLSIKLKKEIEGWLDSSASRPNRQPSLKRIDCRVVVEEGGCKDRCVWKGSEPAGSEGAGSEGAAKCLLHTPETFDLGVKQVSAIDLLINKLIEELIRFPLKRDELLKQRVSQYVKLSEAFRSGNQYIVPEDLPAWSELLRMDWTKKSESKYIEEYTGIEPKDFVAEDAVTSFQTKDIPELATMFGPDFFFIEEGSGSITKIIEDMGIPGTDLEAIGQTPDAPIIEPDIAKYIAQTLKYSFYQLLYPPGNPVPEDPLSVKLQLNVKTTAPFLIIVKLPDERVGVISKSAALDPIELTNLPPKVRVSVTKMFTKV
jgi:hypothetical protein